MTPATSSPVRPVGKCRGGCQRASTRDALWFCVQCHHAFCDTCWDQQIAHNDPEEDGLDIGFQDSGFGAHEKVSWEVFSRLAPIFASLSEEKRVRAHEQESLAKWFGICYDGSNYDLGDTVVVVRDRAEGAGGGWG